jgi:leucyl/phenylalanyl-tRNA--protein transferase
MRQLLRQHKYEVTVNQDFEGVINGCSKAQGRNEKNGAWLGPDIIEAFIRLHRLGYASSIEVWEPTDNAEGRRLVGGLYGVTLRNAFMGESMFSLVPNASKLALIHLAKAMERIGGCFIDCQFETALFKSMGGKHITYDEYMKLLDCHKA